MSEKKKQDETAKAEVIELNERFVYGILEGLAGDYEGKLVDFLSANQREAYEANEAKVDASVKTRVGKLCSAFDCTLEDTYKGELDKNDTKIFVDGIKGILRQEINPFVTPTPITLNFDQFGQTRADVMEKLRTGETVTGMVSLSQDTKTVKVEGEPDVVKTVYVAHLLA
jgi:hypothetical protein